MDLNCPGTITSLSAPPPPRPIKGYFSTNFYAEFSSVAQSCPTLCNPVNRIMSDLPVHHQLPESVMPSNHLILCRPLLLLPSIFPSIRVFHLSQLSASGGQSIGVSASTSVLSMNTQDWSPLGWTGWISLQSKGLSRVFSNTTVRHAKWWINHKPESRLPGKIPTTLDLPL